MTRSTRSGDGELAAFLGLDAKALAAEIGRGWTQVEQLTDPNHQVGHTLLFVQADQPLAAICVDLIEQMVDIGPASGTWTTPGTLQWTLTPPITHLAFDQDPTIEIALNTTRADLVTALLQAMGAAVRAARALKASTMIRCEFCGRLITPEHALNATCCYSCGSEQFGIVY